MMSSTAASTTRRTAIESHANRVHRRRQSCRVYHSKGPDWLRGVHGRRKDCRHVRDDAPRGYVFAGACSASAMTAARASLVRPCDGATIAPFRVVQPSPAVAVKNSCARMAAVAVIAPKSALLILIVISSARCDHHTQIFLALRRRHQPRRNKASAVICASMSTRPHLAAPCRSAVRPGSKRINYGWRLQRNGLLSCPSKPRQ
jgi:hypothetical protein